MNPESFDQVQVPKDVIGSVGAVYLQENMTGEAVDARRTTPVVDRKCQQRVTLEVMETEPVTKGPDCVVVLQAGDSLQRPAHRRAGARRAPAPASWS